jgi:hypothetical protein
VITVIELATEQIAWELKLHQGIRPMAFEAAADGSTRRTFVQLSDYNGLARRFCRPEASEQSQTSAHSS